MHRRTLLAAALGAPLLSIRPVSAMSTITGPASEFTQVLNHIELVAQYIKMAEQYVNMVQRYRNMILNTINAPYFVWQKAQQMVQKIKNVVKKGIGIAYSLGNIDQEFGKRYPGYYTPNSVQYYKKFAEWVDGVIDAAKGAMHSAGIQMEDIEQEQQLQIRLRSLTRTTKGRHQTLKSANMFLDMMVSNAHKLRQIGLAQLQTMTNYQAMQAQKDGTAEAAREEIYNLPERPASAGSEMRLRALMGGTP